MIFRTVFGKAVILGLLVLFSCAPKLPLHPVLTPDSKDVIDPEIVYGVLPNGFQYILKRNTTPIDKVSIHLNIFAGSMHETQQQQGVAHFLEHMLFNGSEHFAPGELAQYFPSIGMDFGGDANAHTSFFNTVYDLDLPIGKKKQIDDAFVIIQDYAKGAWLLESEIDRERGIILAEKRERDSVSYRTFKETLEFRLPGSHFTQRFPIGLDRVIKQADQKVLKRFYDQWYRPENMVLIMVGDFDIATVEAMIEKRFSMLRPRSSFVESPLEIKWVEHQELEAFYHYEPEAGTTDISIETLAWKPFKTQTVDDLKKQTLVYLANLMLQNRFSRMVSKQTVDFSGASVYSGAFLHHVSLSTIRASCDHDKWEKSLEQIEHTFRQSLVYGFEKKELDRVKADYISSLESYLDQSKTLKSKTMSKTILGAINRRKLLLSARQTKKILTPYIDSVTLEDISGILTELWANKNRLIIVTGNAKIDSAMPAEHILNVYRKSLSKSVPEYKGFESHIFPYLPMPLQKVAVKSRQINDLGITTIEFENNVRLNLKSTDFKQSEFLYNVSFGSGYKSEPTSKPGLALVAKDVLNFSGFSKMDADQLEDALAGKKVGISFKVKQDHFSLGGTADPKDAKVVFDLIHHYFNDPGYRKETLNLSKTKYKQGYDSLLRTPRGIMQIKGKAFLAKNDPRFGLPHSDVINRYTLDDIQTWLIPQFEESPVEISIVGDFNIETMIELASKYMGSFKNRKKFPLKTPNLGKIKFPEGERLNLKLDTKIDTGVVRVAFLTDDFWDIKQTRRLAILCRVFSERLSYLIREELGETYSPYVYNEPSVIFEDYGVMHVVVNVMPENHEFIYDKIKSIVTSMMDEGISEKATLMALKPVLNHIKAFRKTNEYWLNSVMVNLSQYPEKIGWAKTMMSDYSSITNKDLEALVKRYLHMEKSARIVITKDDSDKNHVSP